MCFVFTYFLLFESSKQALFSISNFKLSNFSVEHEKGFYNRVAWSRVMNIFLMLKRLCSKLLLRRNQNKIPTRLVSRVQIRENIENRISESIKFPATKSPGNSADQVLFAYLVVRGRFPGVGNLFNRK